MTHGNPDADPDARLHESLATLVQAHARFESFLHEPIADERDQAGVIQAFEYTFELFWKTFQRLALREGLIVGSPKKALGAALQLDLIHPDEEQTWLGMLSDRNLTVHAYQAAVAQAIFERIGTIYRPVLAQTLKRLHDAVAA